MAANNNEHGERISDPWTINNPKDRIHGLKRDAKRHAQFRSRDNKPSTLSRDVPLIRQIVRGFRNNIIGVGVDVDFHGGTLEKRITFQRRYELWAKSNRPDFHGDTNFGGIQSLIIGTMYTHHAAFVIRYLDRMEDQRVYLRLRVVGQNWLDQSKGEKGVEFDSMGRVTGFHIYNNLDNRGQGSQLYRKDIDVIHCKTLDEAEAILGLSDLLSSLKANQDLSDLNDARITQQTLAACMAIIVKGLKNGETLTMRNLKEFENIQSGMIAYLDDQDADIETVTPQAVSGGQETETSLRRDIAIGAGSNYEIATGDFSRVNFASGRFSRQEFKSHVRVMQSHCVSIWMLKIIQWYKDVEIINTPSMESAVNQLTCSFNFADLESISPKEDLDVDITKTRNGIMSPQDLARKYGSNFEATVSAWEDATLLMREAGILFDIDASRVSAAGNIQIQDDPESSIGNPSTSDAQRTTESDES